MKVTREMLAPDLRRAGTMMKLAPNFSKNVFKFGNFVMKATVEKCRDDQLYYKQIFLPRKDGSSLRLCLYAPKERRQNVPGLLWIHGGGFGLGYPEMDEAYISRFVAASGCVVVAPDYLRSVDAPYPAALDDCVQALSWLYDHAEKEGLRQDQLIVGGDSAGGGLTAAVTLYNRDYEQIPLAFQMPFYPELDDRMMTASSQNNNAPVWNSKSNQAAWQLYLGKLSETNEVPIYAAPARAEDLSGLPPTCTFVGSIEPFYDETVAYVEKLRRAGIPVAFKVFPGAFHGFDITVPNSVTAQAAVKFYMKNFNYAVKHYFAEEKKS